MARRCSLTERTVRKALKWLEENGWIASISRPGRTAIYHIDPGSKFTPEFNSPRNMTTEPRKEIPDTPEGDSGEPSRTINKPSEGSTSDDEPLTVSEIQEGWNNLAGRIGLPKVVRLTDGRRRKCCSQIKRYTLPDWQAVFRKIEESPFLRGDNSRGWRADFDFILSDGNFIKILEGKYDRQSA